MCLTESNLAWEGSCFSEEVCDVLTQSRQSFANGLQKTPVFLAHLTRLLKRTGALPLEAPKVALNVSNVELKVAADEFGVVSSRFGVAWNKWPRGRQTGFGGGTFSQKYQQKYTLCTSCAAQPKGAQTP